MNNDVALWLAIIGCYSFNALMWWRITNHQSHWTERIEAVLMDILERLSFIEGARSGDKT